MLGLAMGIGGVSTERNVLVHRSSFTDFFPAVDIA